MSKRDLLDELGFVEVSPAAIRNEAKAAADKARGGSLFVVDANGQEVRDKEGNRVVHRHEWEAWAAAKAQDNQTKGATTQTQRDAARQMIVPTAHNDSAHRQHWQQEQQRSNDKENTL